MKYFLAVVLSLGAFLAQSQEWVEKMNDPNVNFYEVQKAYEQAMKNKSYEKGKGMKQYERWAWFTEQRVYPSGNRVDPTIAWEENQKFKKQFKVQSNKASNWSPLGPTQWTSVSYNPGIGRVNCVRLDPNDSSIIYVGTPSGGAWRSTNNGQSWTPLTDDIPVIGVTDIALNYLDNNIIYIATGDGFGSSTYSIGVLKSTDNGATWNNTGFRAFRSNNLKMRRILMHPTHPDTLWVATTNGLWRTDDGGTGWRQVLTGDVRSVKMKPGDTSTVYATTDRFFQSTDGGNSFTQTFTGLPAFNLVNRMEMALSPNDPNVVYVVAGKGSDASFLGLYKSTNSGLSFTQQTGPNTPNLFDYSLTGSNPTRGQSWYDMAIAANPANANEIYVGGINVWKSTDGGVNWTIKSHWVYPSTTGYTHADIHALEYYNNTLFCGSDGGIFSSTTGANNWTDLSAGLQISQFYRMAQTEQDSTVLMAGAQDNGCNYKTPASVWRHVLGADGMDVAIDPTNSSTIYYEWQNGGISRSYDGGLNRTYIAGPMTNAESGAWVTPFLLDPSNNQNLYAGFENVWFTNNQGNNWARISNFGSTNRLTTLAVAPSNSNVIYTATNDNNIRKTTSRGAAWSNISSGLPNYAITDILVHPLYSDSLWVTFSGYGNFNKVFTSSDGGVSWRNTSTNLPNLPVNTIAVDTATGIEYVGTDIGVYFRDETISPFWTAYSSGLPNVIVNELEIHYTTQKLRAATYGRGIWESPLEQQVITNLPEVAQYIQQKEVLVYPNPSRSAVTVNWSNQNNYELSIYNAIGKLMLQQRTENGAEIQLSEFPTGIYFFHLRNQQGKLEVLKVIKE